MGVTCYYCGQTIKRYPKEVKKSKKHFRSLDEWRLWQKDCNTKTSRNLKTAKDFLNCKKVCPDETS